MSIDEAFDRFAWRYKCGAWKPVPGFDDNPHISPAAMTAAAILSGKLDEAYDDESLTDAVRHFFKLFRAGKFTLQQLTRLTADIAVGKLLAIPPEEAHLYN